MLVAGDEFGPHTRRQQQRYCQDSEIGWVNWKIEDKGLSLTAFVQQLTELRRLYPILRRSRFLTGEIQ
jgi:glycogen operon protein